MSAVDEIRALLDEARDYPTFGPLEFARFRCADIEYLLAENEKLRAVVDAAQRGHGYPDRLAHRRDQHCMLCVALEALTEDPAHPHPTAPATRRSQAPPWMERVGSVLDDGDEVHDLEHPFDEWDAVRKQTCEFVRLRPLTGEPPPPDETTSTTTTEPRA